MTFSEDGKLLVLSLPMGTLVLIDPSTGDELVRLSAPNPLDVGGMSLHSEFGLLAAACVSQHQIQLWDLHSIRRQLADMRLDWNSSGDPPA